MFFAPDNQEKQNLADLILQKIYAKEAQMNQAPKPQLDEKVIKVYTSVGKILHLYMLRSLLPFSYRAGKLPKAFKIIPSLSNWEEVRPSLFLHHADSMDHRAAELVAAGDVCRHSHLRLEPERQAGAALLLLRAAPRRSGQHLALQVVFGALAEAGS